MSEYHLSSVAAILSSFKAASRTDSLYEFNLTGIPKAISLNPQTDKIYVADADKKLYVIDGNTNKLESVQMSLRISTLS